MKSIVFLAVFLCASSHIIGQDTTVNILINGGFEISKNGSMPGNWNGDSHFYSLDLGASTGKYSLKYFNNSPSNYPICSQTVNLKPGATYYASAMIKTSGINGTDYGASIFIQWTDKNGKWLGGDYPRGLKGTNEWEKISTVFSIPGDASPKVTFGCYVRKGMTGTAWFDNALLKPFATGKMNVTLLSPVYRGLIFDEENQEISLSVNLEGKDVSAASQISAELVDASGKKFKSSISPIVSGRTDYSIKMDTKDVSVGSYSIKIDLVGEDNILLDSWQSPIKKISAGNKPAVYFDSNKRLIVNGKPMFPLGMYLGNINEPDLKVYSESKFNIILPYTLPSEDQMTLAAKYDVKVIYSVKDYYYGLKSAPSEISSVAAEDVMLNKTVMQFKHNPSLLCWYNNDELKLDIIDRLNEHYKQISGSDPDHPVLSIIISPDQSLYYSQSCDIIGTDPYVVPNSALFKVGEATKTVNEKVDFSRPVWMVIQTHNIGNYKEFIPDPERYRSPTYDEIRNMTWQAICEGASGLLFYSYFDLKRNSDVSFDTQWSNLKKIAEEIDNVSNVLLSVEKPDVKVGSNNGDNSWFDWIAKKDNNHVYVIVVNNGKDAGKININIPGKYTDVHLMNDPSKKFFLANSEFSDTLGKMEIKIYVTD